MDTSNARTKLVMAGGYDPRVRENIQHLEELRSVADSLNLAVDRDVVFLTSPSDEEKLRLLYTCDALLYTPSGEHFGIVPVEAMYAGLPVVAVNNGGPTETVVDQETGLLREPDATEFASAMDDLIRVFLQILSV
ncbi:MAG: glycosyltransferase [Pseudomonadota bacterium]